LENGEAPVLAVGQMDKKSMRVFRKVLVGGGGTVTSKGGGKPHESDRCKPRWLCPGIEIFPLLGGGGSTSVKKTGGGGKGVRE